jgi:peptidoglycan/LPS O-acetylase OafA/YrhL
MKNEAASNHSAPGDSVTEPTQSYRLSECSSLALDAVRMVAAQAVVIGHGISFFELAPWLEEPRFPYIQNIGVLVFFVLSGFLIAYSTRRKARFSPAYSFRTFFLERLGRIYSAYVPAIVIVVAIDRLFVAVHGAARFEYRSAPIDILANFFMLQDFPLQVGSPSLTSLGSGRPFWTLAVEWWIYLFFGWAFLGRNRSAHRKFLDPAFLVPLAALSVLPLANSVLPGRGNGLFIVWLMGLVLAVCLEAVRPSPPRSSASSSRVALFAGVSLLAAVARVSMTKNAYDLIFAALLALWLFFTICTLDRVAAVPSERLSRWVRFAADYSFSLYLLHYSVLYFLVPFRGDAGDGTLFTLGVLASNVLAMVLAWLCEARHRTVTRALLHRFDGAPSPVA